jgi:hypothetical protein
MRAAFGSTANSKERAIMPTKRLIDARRMRKGLLRGFGWIDHRLLQEGYMTNCTPQALTLYVLLVCASDAQGLSYYSGPRSATDLVGLRAPTHWCWLSPILLASATRGFRFSRQVDKYFETR